MNTLPKPCNQCPFRRKSLPGWLGPWEPMELVHSLAMTPFPCHETIAEDHVAFDDDRLRLCAGAAIFLNNKVEISRCRETLDHQIALRDIGEIERAKVFARSDEFVEHHTVEGHDR